MDTQIKTSNPKTIEYWPLSKLKPNPLWVTLGPAAAEAKRITEDVLAKGAVEIPLHVLPDGVVVDGRVRLEAAQIAKLELVPVIVFPELVEAQSGQIFHMLSANGLRKTLREVDQVLLGLKLWEALHAEGKKNQKLGGKAGAAKKHGVEGPAAPTAKVHARNDAARAIDKGGTFLAHARKLYSSFLAGEAPIWELYAATVGAQQILDLEIAYKLLCSGLSVQAQQGLVDEVLALDEDERRRAARLGAKALLNDSAAQDASDLSGEVTPTTPSNAKKPNPQTPSHLGLDLSETSGLVLDPGVALASDFAAVIWPARDFLKKHATELDQLREGFMKLDEESDERAVVLKFVAGALISLVSQSGDGEEVGHAAA